MSRDAIPGRTAEEARLGRLLAEARLALDLLLQEIDWHQRDALEILERALFEFSATIHEAQTRADYTTRLLGSWDRMICGLILEVKGAQDVLDNPAEVEAAAETQLAGEGGPQV